MRKDMVDVIKNRSRKRGWNYSKRTHNTIDETSSKYESMRRTWKGYQYPRHNYGPLLNFLRSRVGHKWDDVYAEIRANIKHARYDYPVNGLYVHKGILQYQNNTPPRQKRGKEIYLDNELVLQIDGVYYAFTLANLVEPSYCHYHRCQINPGESSLGNKYCISKRTLNSQEKKCLGL